MCPGWHSNSTVPAGPAARQASAPVRLAIIDARDSRGSKGGGLCGIHRPSCYSIELRYRQENFENRWFFVNVLMRIDVCRSQAEIYETLDLRLPFPLDVVWFQIPQLAPRTRKVPVTGDQ
jgi:hypothetical protein